MKTGTVVAVIGGLAVATFVGVYIYKKVNMPRLISFDKARKTVTYNFKGKNNTLKLTPGESLALGSGGYYIENILNNDGAIIGVVLKAYGGSIINSL